MARSGDSPFIAARDYEENDPYRAVRREDPAHSRSASDSSTRRLTAAVSDQYGNDDDPYARTTGQGQDSAHKRASRGPWAGERANSYLPYSHHQRDPAAAVPPICIEDVGSMDEQQDRTISLQVDPAHSLSSARAPAAAGPPSRMDGICEETNPEDVFRRRRRGRWWSPVGRSRRWWRNACVVSVLAAAVVAVIWYFVWPRVPSFAVAQVDSASDTNPWLNSPNATAVSFNTTWTVNMTADNTANWIPTRIRNIAVRVINRDTSQQIGYGDSGTLVLAPRTEQLVPVDLSLLYKAASEDDPTFSQLLSACLVYAQGVSLSGITTKQPRLNIDFLLTIHTAGIAWSATQNVSTPAALQCPT